MQRDKYSAQIPDITSYKSLINHIQKLNKSWIEASKRLSPQILISLLEMSENWLHKFLKTLDPNKNSTFSVAWAGEEKSKNWFDIAREYTEKWHHQMQIRLAVKKPCIYTKKMFFPVLETFMLGIPHAYKNVKAKPKTGIKIEITGNVNGIWYLQNIKNEWRLVNKLEKHPQSIIKLSYDIAWRLFTDSIVDKKKRQFQK